MIVTMSSWSQQNTRSQDTLLATATWAPSGLQAILMFSPLVGTSLMHFCAATVSYLGLLYLDNPRIARSCQETHWPAGLDLLDPSTADQPFVCVPSIRLNIAQEVSLDSTLLSSCPSNLRQVESL